MDQEKMKAAIYCRVSTQDQTLESQKASCIKYCEHHEMEYEVFEEKISGAKSSRPELDRMLQRVRANEFTCVVVWKLDRLGRSTIHLIQLVEEFSNRKVQFVCVTQGINTKDAMGRFFLVVMAGIAELEREFVRERTKLRLKTLKAKGVKLGRPKGSKDKKRRKKGGYYLRYKK
jgi:DNA invertase Pin-like site-specific DNA recombinase